MLYGRPVCRLQALSVPPNLRRAVMSFKDRVGGEGRLVSAWKQNTLAPLLGVSTQSVIARIQHRGHRGAIHGSESSVGQSSPPFYGSRLSVSQPRTIVQGSWRQPMSCKVTSQVTSAITLYTAARSVRSCSNRPDHIAISNLESCSRRDEMQD
jgi:hypothetical protein